jgi:leucyl/phenylalanyl-tRNA--protein transferase
MPRNAIPQLDPDPRAGFPDPACIEHPDGLLAWGGDLSPTRLINAYRRGIFPWFSDDSEILWWSPEPRAVMIPHGWHLSRRLRRTLRQGAYRITLDRHFAAVIDGCASAPRGGEDEPGGTWITRDMNRAYRRLHAMGLAHSVEVHCPAGELIGGLYGVALGRIFFAESKFHRARDASKIALAVLMRILENEDFLLADCQLWNPHLETLGVRLLSGEQFREVLAAGIAADSLESNWPANPDLDQLKAW